MRTMQMSLLGAGFAAALAFGGAGVAQAAPVATGVATAKHAMPSDVTDVQYRWRGYYGRRWYGGGYWGRRYYGWGYPAAAVAAGAIGFAAGAALAAPYYYGPPYRYYAYRPYYYGYAPRYYYYGAGYDRY